MVDIKLKVHQQINNHNSLSSPRRRLRAARCSPLAYESGEVQPGGVKASVERQLERSMSGAQLAPVWCLEYRGF